jgi:hypothetical protein
MRRVIGMDIHRTFAEVVAWEEGRLRPLSRVDMTRAALEGFGKRLQASDESSSRRPAMHWRSCVYCHRSSRA